MKDFGKTLLGIGLTIGLSDRDSFVKSVSDLLAEYQDDPQKAEKWAKAITDYLEQVRNNINLQQSIRSALSDSEPGNQTGVEELTQAIKELTGELRKFKNKT